MPTIPTALFFPRTFLWHTLLPLSILGNTHTSNVGIVAAGGTGLQ